jgi:hypothetical protein
MASIAVAAAILVFAACAQAVETSKADVAKAASHRINPESDLEYLGAFRLPEEKSSGTSWAYGGSGLTFKPNPAWKEGSNGFPGSLFSVGHPYQALVSEFSIPVPVISKEKKLKDLPVARTLQPFADVTGGQQTHRLVGNVLADVQYLSAPRRDKAQTDDYLYWTMSQYYLPPEDLRLFGRCEVDLSRTNRRGPWRLDSFPASATSRYLFDIPRAWADSYVSGMYLAAGRSRLVNKGSWGPALYATAPWNDGDPPPPDSSLHAIELLKYPRGHAMQDYSNADDWEDGAWLTVGAKSAVIFTGVKAIRTLTSGQQYYGAPQDHGCGDKGYNGEPYFGAILFYDPADLAAVARGRMSSYDPEPYATFQVENILFKQGCRRDILGGAAFDRDHSLLYVMERLVDGIYDKKPIVHVWRLRDAQRLPDREPPTVPTAVQVARMDSRQVVLKWAASRDDVGPVIYLIFRDSLPIAITTGTSYTDDSVSNNTTYEYRIEARDAVNNRSDLSLPLRVSRTTP